MLDFCLFDFVKLVREGCSRIIGWKMCYKKLFIIFDILRKLCVVYEINYVNY